MAAASKRINNPGPLPDVVDVLERALEGARQGTVRSIAIVVVNPNNQAELAIAGDSSAIRANALLGGLARATHQLIGRFE